MREFDLTDRVRKYPIVKTGREWPDELMAKGRLGAEHSVVMMNPEVANLPEYADVVTGKHRPQRPRPGEFGGGYWPVLCRLLDRLTKKPSDRLAAVFRTGAIDLGPGGNIVIAFSEDRGQTWSRPRLVVPYDTALRVDYRHGAFGQAANGDLVILYWLSEGVNWNLEEEGHQFSGIRMVRSHDLGKTWTSPAVLDFVSATQVHTGPYGQLLRLADGTLAVNLRGGHPIRQTFLAWSYDHGLTWPEVSVISREDKTETAVLPLRGDEWVCYSRQSSSVGWLGRSHDGGISWTDWRNLTPPLSWSVPGAFVRFPPPSQRVALVHSYGKFPFGVRMILSHDGGRNFDLDTTYVLCDSYWMREGGYPSPVMFEDGTLVVAAYATKDREQPTWGTCAMTLTLNVNDLGLK